MNIRKKWVFPCKFDDTLGAKLCIRSKNGKCIYVPTTYNSVESLFALFDMDAASQI